MRNVVVGMVSVVALLLVGYFIWVQHPRLKSPQLLEQAFREAQQRFEFHQRDAQDPKVNGFLSPRFVVFWGRKDQEFVPGSAVSSIISSWNQHFSSSLEAQPVDFANLSPEAAEHRQAFEEVALELIEATSKPAFVAPERVLSHSNMVPNYINLRAASQALSGYVELCAFEKQYDKAVDGLNALANLGKVAGGQTTLISEMIGAWIHRLHFDTFVVVFSPDAQLSEKQWKRLSEGCFRGLPAQDQFYLAMQAEALGMDGALQDLIRGNFSNWGQPGLLHRLPGMMQRERRIQMNAMCDLLLPLSQGKPYTPPNINLSMGSFAKGQTGILSGAMMPQFARGASVLRVNRRRMLGLGLVSAVLAFKARTGTYPEKLEQAVDLAKNKEWAQPVATYELTETGARLSLPIEQPDESVAAEESELGRPRSWSSVEPGRIVFDL